MKGSRVLAVGFGLVFLLFFQMAGSLVESIYISDLLRTGLDEKALGLVFFFLPALFLPFIVRAWRPLSWFLFAVLVAARGLTPLLPTALRIFSSGLATSALLALFALLLSAREAEGGRLPDGSAAAEGLALALALSVFLRALGKGLDYALLPEGAWLGLLLAAAFAWPLVRIGRLGRETEGSGERRSKPGAPGVTAPLVGVILILGLLWFSFSAPSAIARWTEGDYLSIVLITSLLSLGWLALSWLRPAWLEAIGPRLLGLWNLLFALSLTGLLVAHRVAFPPSLSSPPVVVEGPSLFQGLLLGLCLLLLPVLFLDLRIFVGRLRRAAPSPRSLGPGFAIGAALLVLLVFVQIFTNVWGYIRPISPLFRNLFWLPFAVFTALITLLVVTGGKRPAEAAAAAKVETRAPVSWGPLLALAAVFIATAAAALPGRRPAPPPGERASIRVMTFNTQQANDERGERAFHKQLELIRKVSPDVLALQETDSTRVSLNNNDYVRWYAEQLGYYSYYGPKTVGGSYGTAILSKYPLADTRTVYMYSDKDETGVAEAEIVVGGRRLAIYDVHPDSSAPAMAGFARNLIARSRDKVYAIMMGDYNLRGSDEAYAIMAGSYANAWTRVYPEGVGADGLDMRGDIRIDHIFVSAALEPRDPHYILPPASGTDHPVHWADLFWKDGP